MLERIRRRATILMAHLGLFLIKRSGLYDRFFADWRWATFGSAEKLGIHILPAHYYSPIPNSTELHFDEKTPLFAAASGEILDFAVRFLTDLTTRYQGAYSEIAASRPFEDRDFVSQFRFGKAPYSTVEAELLYGLIRSKRPSQIIEIGAGHTTLLTAEAIRAEAEYAPIFKCIEPYRPNYLRKLPSEVTAFNDTPLQSVPVERFQELQAGDILFIDSSHVAKYGSDVVYEISALLPRLNTGVLVHFHDIFLPYEYPTDWVVGAKFFWNEQYVLSALVQDNPRYEIKYPLHQLYRQRRDALQRLFPLFSQPEHRPGAYWLEITGPTG